MNMKGASYLDEAAALDLIHRPSRLTAAQSSELAASVDSLPFACICPQTLGTVDDFLFPQNSLRGSGSLSEGDIGPVWDDLDLFPLPIPYFPDPRDQLGDSLHSPETFLVQGFDISTSSTSALPGAHADGSDLFDSHTAISAPSSPPLAVSVPEDRQCTSSNKANSVAAAKLNPDSSPPRKRGRRPRIRTPHEKILQLQQQRQRNRLAAGRCRAKRKDEEQKLTKTAELLIGRRRKLKDTLDSLGSKVLDLKEAVVQHRYCGASEIDQHLQRQFRELVESTSKSSTGTSTSDPEFDGEWPEVSSPTSTAISMSSSYVLTEHE